MLQADCYYENIFDSAFNGTPSSRAFWVDGTEGRDWGSWVTCTVGKDQVHDHLRNLNIGVCLWELLRCIPGGWGNICPSVTFEKSWQSGKASGHWKMGNIVLILEEGRKEELGICWSLSIISVPGKIMEEILLKAVLKYTETRGVVWENQCGFTKENSSLINLLAFYNGVTLFMDKKRALICLDFGKAFDMTTTSFSLKCRSMDVIRALFSGFREELSRWSHLECTGQKFRVWMDICEMCWASGDCMGNSAIQCLHQWFRQWVWVCPQHICRQHPAEWCSWPVWKIG